MKDMSSLRAERTEHVLAYDFGTGGIKACLFDAEGACVASGFSAYETFYPADGFREQRPDDWWRATVDSTHALTARLTEEQVRTIRGIGISGHSLGVVPIDGAGRLLCASVPIWSDSRADAEAKMFFTAWGADEAAWYGQTGCGFPAGLYSVFKMMWLRAHEPALWDRVDCVLGTKDYVNFRLTGVRATDNSYASGSGVYDLRARRYSDELIAASGLSPRVFPEIVPSAHVLGPLTAAAAAELGLPAQIPVVAGGVDNSCMALGAGAYREGVAYNSLGSSSWIAVSSAEPLLDEKARSYVFDHVVPGQYASALAIFSAGTSLTWLRDVLGLDYPTMDRLAEEAGALAHGLMFNPTLAGGGALDETPAMRGGFANLDLRHTRGDLVRAVMEGVAFGLRTVLDRLKAQTTVAEPLLLVGGGAKSAVWRQIYADAYGMTVRAAPIGQQCAALGAAALAGVGTGLWKDFGIVDRAVGGEGEIVAPIDAHRERYARAYERFAGLSWHLGLWAKEKEVSV